MAQGTRTKTQKNPVVRLDYLIHIEEIKPWPPTQSLKTLRAVLVQWEHGDRSSGLTNQVVPSLGTGSAVGDGRIEFNESFRLPVKLMRDMLNKQKAGHTFLKNCIEFNLYEPRREKAVKGQLLGTAVLDFAAYGVVKESLHVSVPINCKRTYWNTAQPLLYLKIQSIDRGRGNMSTRESLMREKSPDQNNDDSVSVSSEEYVEEAEGALSTTDDDISSHSSLGVTPAAEESNGGSSPQSKKKGTTTLKGSAGETKMDKEQVPESNVKSEGSGPRSLSLDLSSDISWISKRICSQSLPSSVAEDMEKQQSSNDENNDQEKEPEFNQKSVVNGGRDIKIEPNPEEGLQMICKQSLADLDHQTDKNLILSPPQDDENASSPGHTEEPSTEKSNLPQNGPTEENTTERLESYAEERSISEAKVQHTKDKPFSILSEVDILMQPTVENGPLNYVKENVAASISLSSIDTLKHGKSVRSLGDSSRRNVSIQSNQGFVAQGSIIKESKDATMALKDSRNMLSDSKIQYLEHRINILEAELREAAAIEVSLYSVIAEHGSSRTKVHAPARRLSRSYFHASKQSSNLRGSAAKSIVSGLVLVSKACGNDVPRLTFWFSNSIVLRAIMSKSFGGSKFAGSVGPVTVGNYSGNKKSSPLRCESFLRKSTRISSDECFGDWEDPLTFMAALEKVEAEIFSRIVESIWWQTFTPHMQSSNAEEIRSSMDAESNKVYQRTCSSRNQQQGNFSTELWKMAFRDVYEKICPVRAGGHDCGCLPVLSRLIMKQLIARLDVAMFNAILRESEDEIPTDPVADPISDAKVLPIPSGQASFGAGAQLKTVIGNWSRWLSDLFGIDDYDDLVEDECNSENADNDERITHDAPSKSFCLLNALSDLMMLPKDLLLSRTIRKEVCPTFGPPIIARVLNSFGPDEFCPDRIPAVVLEALNSEDHFDGEEDEKNEGGGEGFMIMNFPCGAAPIVYEAASAVAAADMLLLGDGDGDECRQHDEVVVMRRSGSSVLKKSQTSDDELEELDSPLESIILGHAESGRGNGNALRYQLLRDVWMNCD